MSGWLWRFCNLLMAAFFALAAAVQVNDPDAGLWMGNLMVVASINEDLAGYLPFKFVEDPDSAYESYNNGVWRSLCDLHSAGCVVGTVALACSLVAYTQRNILQEEEGRELFGLLIITVWMGLCRSSAKSPPGGVRLMAAVLVTLFPFVSWLYIYVNKEMRASWPKHCKTVI